MATVQVEPVSGVVPAHSHTWLQILKSFRPRTHTRTHTHTHMATMQVEPVSGVVPAHGHTTVADIIS